MDVASGLGQNGVSSTEDADHNGEARSAAQQTQTSATQDTGASQNSAPTATATPNDICRKCNKKLRHKSDAQKRLEIGRCGLLKCGVCGKILTHIAKNSRTKHRQKCGDSQADEQEEAAESAEEKQEQEAAKAQAREERKAARVKAKQDKDAANAKAKEEKKAAKAEARELKAAAKATAQKGRKSAGANAKEEHGHTISQARVRSEGSSAIAGDLKVSAEEGSGEEGYGDDDSDAEDLADDLDTNDEKTADPDGAERAMGHNDEEKAVTDETDDADEDI